MNKKGFTLTEILGVVVILGLLLLIIGPPMFDRINSKQTETEGVQKELLREAANLYFKDHGGTCVSVNTLKNKGYLNNTYTGTTENTKKILSVSSNGNLNNYSC